MTYFGSRRWIITSVVEREKGPAQRHILTWRGRPLVLPRLLARTANGCARRCRRTRSPRRRAKLTVRFAQALEVLGRRWHRRVELLGRAHGPVADDRQSAHDGVPDSRSSTSPRTGTPPRREDRPEDGPRPLCARAGAARPRRCARTPRRDRETSRGCRAGEAGSVPRRTKSTGPPGRGVTRWRSRGL